MTFPLSIEQRLDRGDIPVLPIPDITDDIATTIWRKAEERRCRLDEGASSENVIIFYGVTPDHFEAIKSGCTEPPDVFCFFKRRS